MCPGDYIRRVNFHGPGIEITWGTPQYAVKYKPCLGICSIYGRY